MAGSQIPERPRTDAQYYLRAEPTAEGRAVLRAHQEHLARVFRDLRINPRLTRADDLHWTPIFLGSPERWMRALRAVGAEVTLTADDLLTLAGAKLPMIASANIGSSRVRPTRKVPPFNLPGWTAASPTGYDVFYNGGTNAVFVLRLHDAAAAPADAVLAHVRAALQCWEQDGRLPGGTAARLVRHPWFPLLRELNGGKPHLTLARGRVRPDRHRDVLRSIRAIRLGSPTPITFSEVSIGIAGTRTGLPLHSHEHEKTARHWCARRPER